jgi:peptidoglycan/LPS O-acetylase OafA/YrhL
MLPSGMTKSASDLHGFALEMAATLPATFTVALASYLLVERPAAALARRLEPTALRGGGSGGGHSGGASASKTDS